jgi:hypothetical protein
MLKRGDSQRILLNEGGAAHLEPEVFWHIVRAHMRVNVDSDHLKSEVWLANVRARRLCLRTNFTVRILFCYINSPRARTIAAV